MVRKTRTNNQAVTRRFRRDLGHALVACGGLAALVVLVSFVRASISTPTRATASLEGHNDDLRTGSILFVPIYGNRCRQRLIDNDTWRIWGNSIVDCDVAMARTVKSYTWSAARVDVVRDGFRKK